MTRAEAVTHNEFLKELALAAEAYLTPLGSGHFLFPSENRLTRVNFLRVSPKRESFI